MRYSLASLLLTVAAVPVVVAGGGNNRDADGGGKITAGEFHSSRAGGDTFAQWDRDDVGIVDKDEYSIGLYGSYDADHDANITEEEWENTKGDFQGTDTWFGLWDRDGDGDIIEEGFDTSDPGSGAFEHWDIDNDGMVDENEFSSGLFGSFDVNNDADVTEEKWRSNFDIVVGDNSQFSALDLDGDGDLVEKEYGEGVFDFYDRNDSGILEQYEF